MGNVVVLIGYVLDLFSGPFNIFAEAFGGTAAGDEQKRCSDEQN